MVSIITKKVKGNEYYFLVHSYREGGKVKQIQKSLGKQIPTNLDIIKEEFISDVVLKRWIPSIERYKEKYLARIKSIPDLVRDKEFRQFGIRFTYSSGKIEGSTLTLREVALAVDEPEVPINKPTNDINEAQFHMKCYVDLIQTEEELTQKLIQKWHSILFSLHYDREIIAGEIRELDVKIRGSKYIPPPPEKVQIQLKELFSWYNHNKKKFHPVLIACIMHFRFVSIHPFYDGNGRMTRLVTNYILFNNNYPMFNIEASIRKSYYSALEKTNLKNDEMRFVNWFFKNYINAIKSSHFIK
jgi:Fic family protein